MGEGLKRARGAARATRNQAEAAETARAGGKGPEMAGIKLRDEVRVFDINGSRAGQPEGGWMGHVVKVGRTLAYIDYGDIRERIETFRLDTQRRNNDPYGQRYFRTLAEVADLDRRSVAMEALKAHGVELSHRHSFTIEQREALAEVVKTWDQEA